MKNKEKIKDDYSSEEIDVTRYKNFMFLVYPEWKNYNDIVNDIRSSFKYYAFITHEPDREENKDHTHFVLHCDDGRTLNSLSNRLGIPINLIKPVKSIRGTNRYLTHIDFPEKKQYSIDDVTISRAYTQNFLKSYDDIETDEEILNNIYLFIDSHCNCNSIELEMELSKFVLTQNYSTIFRRYYNTIVKYIEYKTFSFQK